MAKGVAIESHPQPEARQTTTTTLLPTRCTSLLLHCLSSKPHCTPRHPLVLSSRRQVVASPLNVPPFRCLVVLLCRLSLSRCASWLSCHHLLSSSRCTTLSSSHRAGWLLRCLSLRLPLVLLSSRHSPSPTPSNAVERCCCHRTPPPLPPLPLNAISIVQRCHSCRPSPPSNTNTHLRPSPCGSGGVVSPPRSSTSS